jgi:hypothetical protein
MSGELTGVIWTTSGVIVVAVIGAIGSVLVKRFRSRASEPEMWEKIQELSVTVYGGRDKSGHEVPGLIEQLGNVNRRNAAQARVIRALSRQWPDSIVPRLDPNDILELEEDTIPAHWKVKPL